MTCHLTKVRTGMCEQLIFIEHCHSMGIGATDERQGCRMFSAA